MKKVVLITGTSSGVGFSLALKLAELGHTVYASMRDLDKSKALTEEMNTRGLHVNLVQLDVESTQSVVTAVKKIIEVEGKIDCLVNNAGVGFAKTTEYASEEEVATVMNINFMGVVRTTKAVLTHMREAKSGQIINISSVGGLVGQPFNEIYCASKFALEGYTESLATYVQPFFGIKFSAIEPGGIASEFAATIMKKQHLPNYKEKDEYTPILERYMAGAMRRQDAEGEGVYQSCDQVADCIIDVINSSNPPLRLRTSDWAEDLCGIKTQSDPSGSRSVGEVYRRFLTDEVSS